MNPPKDSKISSVLCVDLDQNHDLTCTWLVETTQWFDGS